MSSNLCDHRRMGAVAPAWPSQSYLLRTIIDLEMTCTPPIAKKSFRFCPIPCLSAEPSFPTPSPLPPKLFLPAQFFPARSVPPSAASEVPTCRSPESQRSELKPHEGLSDSHIMVARRSSLLAAVVGVASSEAYCVGGCPRDMGPGFGDNTVGRRAQINTFNGNAPPVPGVPVNVVPMQGGYGQGPAFGDNTAARRDMINTFNGNAEPHAGVPVEGVYALDWSQGPGFGDNTAARRDTLNAFNGNAAPHAGVPVEGVYALDWSQGPGFGDNTAARRDSLNAFSGNAAPHAGVPVNVVPMQGGYGQSPAFGDNTAARRDTLNTFNGVNPPRPGVPVQQVPQIPEGGCPCDMGPAFGDNTIERRNKLSSFSS